MTCCLSCLQALLLSLDMRRADCHCEAQALTSPLCMAQDLSPTNISINGHPCSIQLNITLSNVVPNDTVSGVSPFSTEADTGEAKVEQSYSSTVSATP